MSTSARVAILPRGVASRVITTAVSRAAWGVALAILVLTIPVLVDVLVDRGLSAMLWAPLCCLAVMILLLVASGVRPSTATRVLYLAGGSASALVYAILLLSADPTLNGEAGFILNRPAMVLVLGGVSIARPLAGLRWSLLGYLLSLAVAVVSSLVVGVPIEPGWGPTIAVVVYAGAFVALVVVNANQNKQIPDLVRLEDDTRRLAIENQFEQRAAAIVHDTVLSDLTAVMNSSGPIDARARERFRADVATLRDAAWLRESADPAAVSPHDAVLRNALEALVSDFQWRGLSVDVTGDSSTVIRITPDASAALILAVRACLDNVLKHAGTSSAELVVSTTDEAVTVMVVDHGVGFDPDAIAVDRLGLRTSVVSRITAHRGSVRIWSTPGSGTSVLISVPGAELDEVVP
ncbi:signal transduction histidine kinase [Conyzicola lurida]|uniref:Signal transduction histidine kinase n=1 Tax=Conyzicola lurida TaxID=1172621 RepID=A0A841AGH9_9MICO|nr:ATP-binding protein [Conyzicola lurida]MBB5842327.1 signal transduction histidine kinase [Conyzicola lurida]